MSFYCLACTLALISLQLRWSTFALCSDSSSTRFDRKIAKAVSKLDLFAQRDGPKILVVDGYNVRGMARFDWSHIELQCRIDAYCRLFPTDYSVLVWDHGSSPSSIQVAPGSILLFSGLSQRADDVIVKEVDRLLSFGKEDIHGEASLVVVTNDIGLTDRLRKKATCPVRLLTMDSTRFVEIIGRLEPTMTKGDRLLHDKMEDTKDLVYQCRTKLRGGSEKREKTWERVALAESLRRFLLQHSPHSKQETTLPQSAYLQDLESRGYTSLWANCTHQQTTRRFSGPTRLDKRQKRALARFNSMIEKLRQD